MTNGELVRDAVSPKAFTNVLDSFFTDAIRNSGVVARFRPNADIIENDTQYELRLSLPGYTKEAISLELQENKLTIKNQAISPAENNTENKAGNESEKTSRYLVREIYAGDFSRTFRLPENADKEKISAEFKNGILSVIIEKTDPKAGVKSIEIQ